MNAYSKVRADVHDPTRSEFIAEAVKEKLVSLSLVKEWYGWSTLQAERYLQNNSISLRTIAAKVKANVGPDVTMTQLRQQEATVVALARPRVLSDAQRAYLRQCDPHELRFFEPWVLELARKEGIIR